MEEVAFEQVFGKKRAGFGKGGDSGEAHEASGMPNTKVRGEGMNMCGQEGGVGRLGWAMEFRQASWALLGGQRELLKGLEQGRRIITMVH